MVEAPVGWQCRGCVRQESRKAPVTRWRPAGAGRLGNSRLTPAVIALIAINVVVYLWETHTKTLALYVYGGERYLGFPSAVDHFALIPNAIHHGQWYRLLTAAFLHANFSHILFNMLTLAIIGSAVEAELGSIRFVALYLASALGGSVASYLVSKPYVIGLGASGAIFGLMGAYFVLARYKRWETRTIVGLIVINLVITFADSNIDWRAHLGGLITGAAVAFGMTRLSLTRTTRSQTAEVGAGVGVAVAAVIVLSLLSLLPPGHVNI
jgi:membrane associated rhomboid family serine protease